MPLRKLDETSVYYAAYSYLDEWMRTDRRFHQVLAFEKARTTTIEEGSSCLVGIAKKYGVIRTLQKTGEEPRLRAAYEELQATQLPEKNNVVEVVTDFAKRLRKTYHSYALSAASKFLWMRFRSPVVIYDSIVSKWLSNSCTARDDSYSDYCKMWFQKYSKFENCIQKACSELTPIKKFTLAHQVSDIELTDWTKSQWFCERVFDHYMLEDAIEAGEEANP